MKQSDNFQIPILLIIFNRPDTTVRVFEEIRKIRPARLFIAADGPRAAHPTDPARCRAARAVVEHIDWPCEVYRDYSEINLGCGKRPATAISWVFKHAEEAIILEDDCVPDQTFFPFCEELLKRYKNDTRVMSISGNFFQDKNPNFNVAESYYVSMLPHSCGWATWKRAWDLYDFDLTQWPALRDTKALLPRFQSAGAYERFERVWNDYYEKRLTDSWDGQWAFAIIAHGGLCLCSTKNLITNIGFNEQGTHTKSHSEWANMPIIPMTFPLVHPKELSINRKADEYMFRYHFGIDKKIRHRILRPFKNRFPNAFKKIKNALSLSS